MPSLADVSTANSKFIHQNEILGQLEPDLLLSVLVTCL